MQISYLFASDFLFKNVCKLAQHAETIRKNVWQKSNNSYSLSIRVQTTINYISICFYHTIGVKENFFQSASWKRHCSTYWREQGVWTLIDNGKLANQIARLAAIVEKIKFPAHARLVWHKYRLYLRLGSPFAYPPSHCCAGSEISSS